MSIRPNIEKFSSSVAVIAVLVSIFFYIYSSSYLNEIGVPLHPEDVSVVIYKEDAIEIVTKLESEVKDIKAQLKGMSAIPSELPVSSKIIELEEKIKNNQEALKNLKSIIIESPEKALEMPLMRRDISALEKQINASVKNIEAQVARAYDMFKWVTGTMVLGILSLAIGMFFKEKNT